VFVEIALTIVVAATLAAAPIAAPESDAEAHRRLD